MGSDLGNAGMGSDSGNARIGISFWKYRGWAQLPVIPVTGSLLAGARELLGL